MREHCSGHGARPPPAPKLSTSPLTPEPKASEWRPPMMKRLIAMLIVLALFCFFAMLSSAPAGSARAAATPVASGEVDPSFDPAAITTQFGATFVNAVAVQPDGKI